MAHRREYFRGFWTIFWLLNSLQKEVFLYTRIQSLLVNGVATASSHALWRVLSNKVIWELGHCWVDTEHINTFEEDSVLSKFVVCFPPSRSRRPRLGLCRRKRFSHKRFRLKSTPKRMCMILHSAECMRTRQSWYETVGDGSNDGDSSHSIVLFCERYWHAGVGGCGSERRALSGQDSPTCELGARTKRAVWAVNNVRCFWLNCFGIEMVLYDLYLKRFDLTKGLLFDTFFEHIELPVKLPDYFLRSNKSNINQS